MLKKRGQDPGSKAAGLIGIITLIIIFYILFLPPEDRAALLGDDDGVSPPSGGEVPITRPILEETELLSKSPGRIISYEEIEDKNIPNIYLTESVEAEIIAESPPIYVKNGWFDKKEKEFTFTIEDIDQVDNVRLSFSAPLRKGIMNMELNGKKIYEYKIISINPQPIVLSKADLEDENILKFSVAGVGMQFWKTNEYSLEAVKIIADVTDISQQKARNVFYLTDAEYSNIETARLKFIPYCANIRVAGTLNVFINERNIFSGVPICDDPYFASIDPRYLRTGENYVVLTTSKGSYSVEQIKIDLEAKPAKSLMYYFETEPAYFEGYEEVVSVAKCGEIDGICPAYCDEDQDQDCCFTESEDNYWCDVEPDDADDRCISVVDQSKCARCESGYEDEEGESPELCEGQCGDDEDGICPAGCNKNYDKDCCFNLYPDGYWCEDVPVTGLSSVCEASLTSGECDDCSSGYEDEDGREYDCTDPFEPVLVEKRHELIPEFGAMIYIEFVDDGKNKDADVSVNGHRFNIDQEEKLYSREISDWLRPDTNYIEIVPFTELNIVSLEIRLE